MEALSDLDVLILDCQATGASPAFGSVLELGWCIMRPGSPDLDSLQSHWIALPKGLVVSRQVRRLTGFEDSCAAGALPPEEAWNRLRASMKAAPMPAAIHFARFELSFLGEWAKRFEPDSPFPLDAVCVHALALRLYPELPRRNIRALAGYLGFGLHLERRSLGHVEATAFIWRKLCENLAERGVHTWTELQGFLSAERAPLARSSKRRYPIQSSRYRALPDSPGVYRFVRSNGDVLYVGKATSVKKRVASHFTARTTREHSIEMLTQASDVHVVDTATALEAALLENETIKRLRPVYNIQLVSNDGPAWFTNSSFEDASEIADPDHSIGPLPSKFSLRPLGALIQVSSSEIPPTRALRAWSVGAVEFWAPDPDVFAAGFANFRARHLDGAAVSTSPPVGQLRTKQSTGGARDLVFAAAKNLILAKIASKGLEEPEEEPAPDAAAPVWDPERVTRHLERALVQSYQLMRRARWLGLLHESNIVFREPESARTRLLVVRDGEVVEAHDRERDEAVPAPARGSPLRTRRASFDRIKYDRLRILTTELKRVLRDGGEAAIVFSRERRLSGPALASILRWV